jgi:hypothetical protein
MRINLSPQRRDDTLAVVKVGNTLAINGEVFDFSNMQNGDTLPIGAIQSLWFAGEVNKEGDELSLSLYLPNPWNYSPEQAFPANLINVPDGPVVLPQSLPV